MAVVPITNADSTGVNKDPTDINGGVTILEYIKLDEIIKNITDVFNGGAEKDGYTILTFDELWVTTECKETSSYSNYKRLIMYVDTLIPGLLGSYREDLILEILHFMFDANQLYDPNGESAAIQYKLLHTLMGIEGQPNCLTNLVYNDFSPEDLSDAGVSLPNNIEQVYEQSHFYKISLGPPFPV